MVKNEKTVDSLLTTEIYGYCRISVDEELDRDNTSIENQKNIIGDYTKRKFPKCKITYFVDRDKSGYTFEQRDDYQRLRKILMDGTGNKILIVKDFSRFSRRNSKGLVELEDLRDAGVRIISIGDSIDYPTFDDWTAIQFRFLINEMPVTDASKKVKSVIKRRQEEGQWLCCVPYGYVISNMKKQEISIVPDEAEIVRKVYELYNKGWGYKRIAEYLTENNIPTARMKEKERIEARGDEYKRKDAKSVWSIVSVQHILVNDFYIGTFRQHKYQRKKINGLDVRVAPEDQIVFENHHEPIIDIKTWAVTQDLLKRRTSSCYRGIKKYDNVYTGFLFCGDCGSPMFSMSRPDIAAAYVCGTYHKRGKKGCTSHHTRVDMLDAVVKQYVCKVRDNSADMLKSLEASVKMEASELQDNENTIFILKKKLEEAQEELKVIKKRKLKEITKWEIQSDLNADAASQIEIVEAAYADIEREAVDKIKGLKNQIGMSAEKQNDIIRLNRMVKTVTDVFNDIVEKETLDRVDIQLILDKILVYSDHIDVKLKADIDALLQGDGKMPLEEVDAVNFDNDSKVILKSNGRSALFSMSEHENGRTTLVRMKSTHHCEQLFTVNVVNNGDPLEIFTDKDGEIILKKYSPLGELGTFAQQYVDSTAQILGCGVCVCDRDQIIAVAGIPKRELLGKSIHKELEDVINDREAILARKGEKKFVKIISGSDSEYTGQVVQTIICEGDAIGAVILLAREMDRPIGEAEQKAAIIAASFLGRQMEG